MNKLMMKNLVAVMDPRPQALIDHMKRLDAADELSEALIAHGDFHPATFAAYARAHVAWEGRIKPPRPVDAAAEVVWADLAGAYTTAQLRAFGTEGWANRSMRKMWHRRKAPLVCAICKRRVTRGKFGLLDTRLKCEACAKTAASPGCVDIA